jgi:hypothetical protein
VREFPGIIDEIRITNIAPPPPPLPPPPILVSPQQHAINQQAFGFMDPFSWQSVATVSSYHIQLATDSFFISPVYDDTINQTSVGVPQLSQNTHYYWHASSINGNGEGIFSPTREFSTLPSSDAQQVLVPLTFKSNAGAYASYVRYFGVAPGGTKCVDTQLGEFESPPVGPDFEPRIRNPHPSGYCPYYSEWINIVGYIGPAQVDTYIVSLNTSNPARYPVTISWPDLNSKYSGPVTMKYSGSTSVTIDMKTTNIAMISDSTVNIMRIYASGPNIFGGSGAINDSSILALWHFDEGSGTTLHDASLYHNDGEIHNAGWVNGAAGKGLHFDGLTSYVILPNSASLKPANNFKIEAWFSLDTLIFPLPPPDTGGGGILSNLGVYPTGGGYELAILYGGKFRFDYRAGTPVSNFSQKIPTPLTHYFYYVAVTYEHTGSTTTVTTYLNGALADISQFPENIHYTNTPSFYIGTNRDGRAVGGGGAREFPGIIDEIRITGLPPSAPNPGTQFTIPLTITDNSPATKTVPRAINQTTTINFGVHPSATYCIDAALGEVGLPPVPPVGAFDTRFVDPRGNPVSCFGEGMNLDLRQFSNSSQIDTYRVRFQPNSGGYPMTLSWHSLGSYYSGPVTLKDIFGGVTVNVNMKAESSYTVTDTTINRLLIIAEGPGGPIVVPDTTRYRTFSQTEYAQRTRRLLAGVVPTAANVRDETFMGTGWFNNGLNLGIPKPDSVTYYGWLTWRRNLYRLPRFLPHTGPARGFDYYISGHLWHVSRYNPAVKYHDNHLAGEQYILKFNIGASDLGITPVGFGDLIFNDPLLPTNPCNGKTVREIMAHTDSALTFYKHYSASYFFELDSCLSKINRAFLGPITDYSVAPLTIAGTQQLSSILYLHSNPNAHPVAVPPVEYEPPAEEPIEYALYQNYPNPFNPTTVIDFNLSIPSLVTLKVYNVLGQEVATLFDNALLEDGMQSVEYDASALSSGIYFYRVTAVDEVTGLVNYSKVRKMLLVK